MELDCYDMDTVSRDGRMHVRALVPDGDGGKDVLEFPAPYDPYCYIEDQAFTMDPLRVTDCVIGDGAPDGYMRIEGPHPSDVRAFADRFAFQTYESDVGFARRLCINEDVGIERVDPGDVLYFDIEVDDRGGFTEPGDATDRIISIAGVGGDGAELYFDDPDEEELVSGFFEAADDYVALVGWNSVGYDFEYLDGRCVQYGLDIAWQRWLKVDLMPLYDMLAVPTKTVSTKLDDTGERELGRGKTGVSAGEGRLYELWEEDPERLREYNVRDCELVRDIDRKYDILDVHQTVCDLAGFPPGETCYQSKHGQVRFAIGQVVDAHLLSIAHRRGVPQPNKRSYDKPDDFPGGYVLEPVPGMYDSLVVPDYSGMYPNIVRAWNFGRETFVEEENVAELDNGDYVAVGGRHSGSSVIRGETGGFVHPDDGGRSIPAEAADELVEYREGAADIVDKGVKALNNTLYGVFAADHQRYFGPHSENITLIGQRLTGIVEELAGQGHPDIEQVVYGDTDSVMIEMTADESEEARVEAAHRIASDLEEEMQEWAEARGAFAEYLELDVDDVYARFYIGDKKKRYFGNRIFDGERCDNFKVRGFETRQGSWPRPVRDFQEDLMHAKLEGEATGPIIREARERLESGEWDMELAKAKKLNQPVSEYKVKGPHVRMAEELRDEFGRGAVQVGDKVGYVKYGGDKHDVTWVHDGEIGRDFRPNHGWCPECGDVVDTSGGHPHGTEGRPHFREHHYGYIWRNMFEAVMDSIDVSEHEQTGLGSFA